MAPRLICGVFVLLAFYFMLVPVEAKGDLFHRQKREWIIAPRQLKENHDYTGLESIARIRSDKENYTKIIYLLSGPGVDQPPVGRFGVNPSTGFVKIYTILDREEIATYHLKGIAKYVDGSYAEKDIDLKIKVLDENDCPPVIKVQQAGSVNESSKAGTVVMKVIATDDDEANTIHSQIHYAIAEESNTAGMFFINSQTGEVMVRQSTLDRETKDMYKLKIIVSDLNGQPGGNTGTGEIEVKILDINDNIPTLEKNRYEGHVEENTYNREVMRVKAVDMDLIHTENWQAVYEIVSGNEGGYFTVTTDSKTNEGIIMINKPLDYEEIKTLNLELAVRNKASYNFGSAMTGASVPRAYPVKINVVNQKEGPRFQPTVKVVSLSEDHKSISLRDIITNYAAFDSDTLLTATNVRYAKIRDNDNWLIIDEKTADIRLNKLPDRESKFLINGTYYAEIICISNETPSKTATGTIAIQVEDFNDHCPKLTMTSHTMCLEQNVLFVTAVDEDEVPNSAPFQFEVISDEGKGKWSVEPFNDTTAILRDNANLWPGSYQIFVKVEDQQGHSCDDVEMIDVTVCNCDENTKGCDSRRTTTAGFGAAGILLLLLGLLLLLLVPLLLLFCLCGGAMGDFKPIPFDTKQQLIAYHTEGQGEDKEVPLLHAPVEVDVSKLNTAGGKDYLSGLAEGGGAAGGATLGAFNSSTLTAENMHLYNQYNQNSGEMKMDYMDSGMMLGQEHAFSQYGAGAFDGMALSEQFLGGYYASKSDHAALQSQQKDGLLVYDYEGQGSLAGSVGCCSLLENDDDLAFLNDLGPKFKTLAEVCQGSTLVAESATAGVSVSPPKPVPPVIPSTHTHIHTHSETVKERDHVNVSTSNVSSGLSTMIQEGQVTGGSATLSKVHMQDNIVVPTSTLLVQQPAMYYAATPMYVVESKPQMVLVAGGAQQAVGQVGHVGLSQGLVQVGSLQGSQGMLLVEGQVGMGGGLATGAIGTTGQVIQGVSQGTLPMSRQVLVMENGVSGGGQGAQVAQAFVQSGQGSTEQRMEVKGQSIQGSLSLGSTGSHEDFALTATPKLHGTQRVVVQQKKVSVTERKI
ncbi:desmoglein-2-like protein [Aulostomus maculatus]